MSENKAEDGGYYMVSRSDLGETGCPVDVLVEMLEQKIKVNKKAEISKHDLLLGICREFIRKLKHNLVSMVSERVVPFCLKTSNNLNLKLHNLRNKISLKFVLSRYWYFVVIAVLLLMVTGLSVIILSLNQELNLHTEKVKILQHKIERLIEVSTPERSSGVGLNENTSATCVKRCSGVVWSLVWGVFGALSTRHVPLLGAVIDLWMSNCCNMRGPN